MKLRGSHLVSLAILAGIGGWMFTGQLIEGGQADPNAETIVEREAKRETEAFRVRVTQMQPSKRTENLLIRGRTQADAIISVKAETGGTVESRPVEKGQFVKPGDLLCVIDKGTRNANVAQARTALIQAEADYEANAKLAERGFATKSRVRTLKAAMDAAKAALASAEEDLKRTEIRATVAGQVQDPLAQAGDNLAPGGVCLTLMDTNPMLFTGQIPERDVATVKVGTSAKVALVSGQEVEGKVRFISPVADPNTRTFNMEVEIPNPQNTLRDGLTATATISLESIEAYQIDASWLTLADDGRIGVRSVDSKNEVAFNEVKIIALDEKKAWVNGLQPGLRVITLGQNYVAAGEKVDPVTKEQLEALEKSAASPEAENQS